MNRAMKDSGIPWIGEIPEGWETCHIKYVMRNISVKNNPSEQVLSLYRDYGIIPKDSRDDNYNVTSEDTSTYKLVEKGNFVINKMKAWQGSMAVSDYRGIISPAYYVCRFVNENVHKRYIHYLLRNDSYKEEYKRLSTGMRVGQWDLNIDIFLRIKMVLPPLAEQEAIAAFLDRKCGEVDEMVSLQEQVIEELKAYKQSVITEAVTTGLNPSVPMKSSGIDWIGQIPSHWDLAALKRVCKVNNGKEIPLEVGIDSIDAIPVFGSGGIFKYTNQSMYCGEAVMFGRKGTLGKPIYVNGTFWTVDTMYYLTHQGMFPKYNYYQLCAFDWSPHITQTALPSVVASDIVSCIMPLPPLSEQREIADYLDRKCADIDALIALKQQKIEELREYKKSLIYEYVTGKKTVPCGG